MNWLDLVIIVIFLIFLIIGIYKGFMSSVLSNFSFSINALLSCFLCKPFASLYNWFGVGGAISSSYRERLLASSAEFGTNLLEIEQAELSKFVRETINSGNMSGFEKFMFKNFINKKSLYDTLHSSSHTSRSLCDIISETYSTFFVTIIAFVTSLLVLFVIVLLIRLLINKLRTVGFVKAVDNSLGAVYGLFRGFLTIVVLCIALKLISPLSFMQGAVSYTNNSFLGSFFYGQVDYFLDNFLSFSAIIKAVFK